MRHVCGAMLLEYRYVQVGYRAQSADSSKAYNKPRARPVARISQQEGPKSQGAQIF